MRFKYLFESVTEKDMITKKNYNELNWEIKQELSIL